MVGIADDNPRGRPLHNIAAISNSKYTYINICAYACMQISHFQSLSQKIEFITGKFAALNAIIIVIIIIILFLVT